MCAREAPPRVGGRQRAARGGSSRWTDRAFCSSDGRRNQRAGRWVTPASNPNRTCTYSSRVKAGESGWQADNGFLSSVSYQSASQWCCWAHLRFRFVAYHGIRAQVRTKVHVYVLEYSSTYSSIAIHVYVRTYHGTINYMYLKSTLLEYVHVYQVVWQ